MKDDALPESSSPASVKHAALCAEAARLEALLEAKMPRRVPEARARPATALEAKPLLRRLRNSGAAVRVHLGAQTGDSDALRADFELLAQLARTWEPQPFEQEGEPLASVVVAFTPAVPAAEVRALADYAAQVGVPMYVERLGAVGSPQEGTRSVEQVYPDRVRVNLRGAEPGVLAPWKALTTARAIAEAARLAADDAAHRTACVSDVRTAALLWALELADEDERAEHQGRALRIEKELRYDTDARLLAGLRKFGHPVVALVPLAPKLVV